METLDVTAAVLLVVGGLNWGMVGLFNVDLVAGVFGSVPVISTIVYTLVGVAAVYQIVGLPFIQRRWRVSPRLVPAG